MQLPVDFCERMRGMLKDDYDAFCDAFINEPVYRGIRINSLKPYARDKVFSRLPDLEKIKWCDGGYYIDKAELSGKDACHMGGLIYFQEPSAMSTVEALGIEKGDFVLDLCAAPGGKATQAAEKLCGSGMLVANEIVAKRSLILAENIARMGIKNAVVTNETPEHLAEKYPEFFDKIIVDAPCSGEGMFKKEPRAIEEWSIEHTKSCAIRQQNILKSAFSMLKKGGRLVYSTCTFAPCENEGIADWVLDNFDDIKLCPIELDGMTDGKSEYAGSARDLSYTKRIMPHLSKGEGHFVALFEKTSGGINSHLEKYKCEQKQAYLEFERDNLSCRLDGEFINFGEKLYLMPFGLDIDRVRVLSAGLFLGECKKGRFEPSHALCLALDKDDFLRTVTVDATEKYYRGETLSATENGWTAVIYDDIPIGWGKTSNGILKNHFPKYLRF